MNAFPNLKPGSWTINLHSATETYRDFPLFDCGQKVVDAMSQYLRLKNNYQIDVIIISETEMMEINQIAYPFKKVSDVLSFQLSDYQPDLQNPTILGEIYFCYEVIKTQAKTRKVSFEFEATTLLIHSLLHFCGYTHNDQVGDLLMRKIIDNIRNFFVKI